MGVPCRRDCRYYSTYTETCDFTLMNYRARPCTTRNCTVFERREKRRDWQMFTDRARTHRATETAEREDNTGTRRWKTADCGHMVYSGGRMFFGEDGRRVCPECVAAAFDRLTTTEKACLLGFEMAEVVD